MEAVVHYHGGDLLGVGVGVVLDVVVVAVEHLAQDVSHRLVGLRLAALGLAVAFAFANNALPGVARLWRHCDFARKPESKDLHLARPDGHCEQSD